MKKLRGEGGELTVLKNGFLWGMLVLYFCLYLYLDLVIGFFIYAEKSPFGLVYLFGIATMFVVYLFFQWLVWKYASVPNRDKLKIAFRITSCIALIPVIILVAMMGLNESGSHFDRQAWLQNEDQRVYMVDDLLEEYPLKGKTKQEVIQLLGPPTEVDYLEPNNIVYYLGPERNYISIDSEWLVIWFDKHGKVIKYIDQTD